ncbi:hypothetical protein HYDPIDRAFT_104426 [Hydnomerulius pinastri MD-312]|nr:hypothetical protein HYDPIDRAFT_104426 [Hydnomerulius pinastri MD-312]
MLQYISVPHCFQTAGPTPDKGSSLATKVIEWCPRRHFAAVFDVHPLRPLVQGVKSASPTFPHHTIMGGRDLQRIPTFAKPKRDRLPKGEPQSSFKNFWTGRTRGPPTRSDTTMTSPPPSLGHTNTGLTTSAVSERSHHDEPGSDADSTHGARCFCLRR